MILKDDIKALKNLTNELKKPQNYQESLDNLPLSNPYFCNKLHKIFPGIANIKQVDLFNFQESLNFTEKFQKNLLDVSLIYENSEYYKIIKMIKNLITEKPNFLVKAILEFNLFNKEGNLLFNKFDYFNYMKNLLTKEIKFKQIEKETEIYGNMVNIAKELFTHYIKNKSRQTRNLKYLFDSLSIMVIEANNKEKEILLSGKAKKFQGQNNQKIGLVNFFLKNLFEEILEFLDSSFELEIFANYELDYIFYVYHNLASNLLNHTHIISMNFASELLSKGNWIKDKEKENYSAYQKYVLDQMVIFNGLKNLYKGLSLICVYLKKKNIQKGNKYSEDEERLRISNRFIYLKNTSIFIDFSFETFKKDTDCSENEVRIF